MGFGEREGTGAGKSTLENVVEPQLLLATEPPPPPPLPPLLPQTPLQP